MKKPLLRPFHKKHSAADQNFDQIVAEALSFLASDHDRLDRFFSNTGLCAQTLRAATRDPAFGESLLDYFASDERLLLAFCAERGLDPARLEAWRQSLTPPADDV